MVNPVSTTLLGMGQILNQPAAQHLFCRILSIGNGALNNPLRRSTTNIDDHRRATWASLDHDDRRHLWALDSR